LCPGARDTVLSGADGEMPALLIPGPAGAKVVAAQFAVLSTSVGGRRVPQEGARTSLWRLVGSDIELPGGARADARWGELVRRYGPGLAEPGHGQLTTRLCSLTGFGFTLDVPALDTAKFALLDSLSTRVPRDTRVTEITILPGAPQPAARECGGEGPYLQPNGAEQHAIATSQGMVRRAGDTLFIRAANGSQVTFVTNPENNDMQVTYTYVGKTANGTLHQIFVQGWENSWTRHVHAVTGQRFDTVSEPVFSPDGRRIAASSYVMEVCENVARLEIYRLTDSIPALEFEIEPRDCMTDTGWAPRDLKWLSPDTLAFMADSDRPVHSPARTPADTGRWVSRPMLAIRDGNSWRIVPRR
jgi:hypothetical protein